MFIENNELGLGFITQDLEKIYPELVSIADDEEGMKSINYAGLIAPLVKTVQEQQSIIEEQNQKINNLEDLYNQQQKKIESMERQIDER